MFKNKINSLIEEAIKSTLMEDDATIEVNYNADEKKIAELEKKFNVIVHRSGRDKIKVSGDANKVWNAAKEFYKGAEPAAQAHPTLAKKLYGTDNPKYTGGRDRIATAQQKLADLQKSGKDKFKAPDGKVYKIKDLDPKSADDVKSYYRGNKEWENIVDKYKDEIKAYGMSGGASEISPDLEDDLYDWIEEYEYDIDSNYPSGPDDQDGFDDFYDAHFGDSDPNAQRQDMMDKE